MTTIRRLIAAVQAKSPTGSAAGLRLLRIAAWILLLVIAFVTLSPIGVRPRLPMNVNLERGLAYLVLGFVFALAYPRKIWIAAVVVVFAGVGLELLQQIRPGRHGRTSDAAVKIGFAILGLAIGWILSRWTKSRLPPS